MLFNTSYAAHTKYAFAFTETVAIAELLCQGLNCKTIKQRVVEDDLFQIRSRNSRQGAFQTIWQRLEKRPYSALGADQWDFTLLKQEDGIVSRTSLVSSGSRQR